VPSLPRGIDIPDTPNTAVTRQEEAQIHPSHKTKGKDKAPASELVSDPDEIDPEDYNIRSTERTELLMELTRVLRDVPVPPALWALCQLCELEKLSALIIACRAIPTFLDVTADQLASIPLLCKLLVLRLYRSFDHRYAHS